MNDQTNTSTDNGNADELPGALRLRPVDYLAVVAQTDPLCEKLADPMTPGCQVEFDPDEAERAGAFVEDALSERDAAESAADLLDAGVPDDKPD